MTVSYISDAPGNIDDFRKLLSDLISIFEWLKDNQLSVAVEKCAVLHLGMTNPRREYEICGSIIPSVDSIRDIGIEVDKTMKFSGHCKSIAQRANRMSNLFFLTFRRRA